MRSANVMYPASIVDSTKIVPTLCTTDCPEFGFTRESSHLFLIKAASTTVAKLFKRQIINQSALESDRVPKNKLKLLITQEPKKSRHASPEKIINTSAGQLASETSIS